MQWDPEQYLQFAAERGRPFQRPDGARRRRPTRPASWTWAAGRATSPPPWPTAGRTPTCAASTRSPEMIEQAREREHAARGRLSLRGGRPAGRGDPTRAGRRTREQRDPAVGARPPRPAAGAGRRRSGRVAGSPSRCPATSASAATPRWPRSRRRRAGRDDVRRPRPGPARRSRPRRPTSSCSPVSAAPSTRGRRRTCTCCAATDAVVRWVTGHRAAAVPPGAGDEAEREEFLADYRALAARRRTRSRTWGTVLPFRRIFVVARRVGVTA